MRIAPRALVVERAVDHADRVIWRSDARTGTHVAIAVHSSRFGPSVGGVMRLSGAIESTDVVAATMARAELLTMAAVTSDALVGGAAIGVMGSDPDPRLIASMVDALTGAVWIVPYLGNDPPLGRAVAAASRYAADPGTKVGAQAIFDAVRRGWDTATDTDNLEGTRILVLGGGELSLVLQDALRGAGAVVQAIDNPESPLDEFDIVVNCAAQSHPNEFALNVRCRVLVGAIGGLLDDEHVWQSMVARGVTCVPGSVVAGPVLRHAAGVIASRRETLP